MAWGEGGAVRLRFLEGSLSHKLHQVRWPLWFLEFPVSCKHFSTGFSFGTLGDVQLLKPVDGSAQEGQWTVPYSPPPAECWPQGLLLPGLQTEQP